MANEGMAKYTKWCCKYPWHVTKDMPVPDDCSCDYCRKQRKKVGIKSSGGIK